MKTTYFFSKIIVLLGLMSAVVSCTAPQAIVRMDPISPNVRWNHGQAFASDTVTGIIVECAFDKATPEYNVFDVSVINASNMAYLLDPINFEVEEIAQKSIGMVHYAIDPETMLLSIDKMMSKEEADAKNAKVGNGIAMGALAVAAVALAVTDDVDMGYRASDPDLTFSPSIMINSSNNNVPYDYMTENDEKREMWSMYAARKTTLQPGYSVGGKIFFHRFEKPGTYVLKLIVDDQLIRIPFTQTTYEP